MAIRVRRFPGALVLGVLIGLPISRPVAGENLAADIRAVTDQPTFKNAHWGILVVDAKTGNVLFEQNADKLFVPASTTKLYSVAAALDALGADYVFRTPIVRRGEVDKTGRLDGDLILIASGDPTMGGRTTSDGRIAFTDSDHTYANGGTKGRLTDPDPLAGLNILAQQVWASGIRRIAGDVLVDDRLFDKAESTGSGPGQITPIRINDNLVDFVIEPTEIGKPAKVEWRPQTCSISVDARIGTAPKSERLRIAIHAAPGERIVLRGQIPAGHRPLVRVHEVSNSAAWARSLLIEALERADVVVDASPLAPNPFHRLPSPEAVVALPKVAELISPPFSEVARLVLKVSHNLHASTLPLFVAVKNGKRTLGDGLRLQHAFLKRAGVDVDSISFGGGAGGSRADYTTPRASVQLLAAMVKRNDFGVYRNALPILGVDGTLAEAVAPGSRARGAIRAKTGTLFWENTMNANFLLTSKALAGYMTASSGRELIFAMMVNHVHLKSADETNGVGKILGQLCEVVHSSE